MFLVLKKRRIILGGICLLLAVGLTGAVCGMAGNEKTFLPNEGKVFVIDAGHPAKR
ncbi:MAG: hypothetical protein IJC78_03850 [Clostridia bacterium]|nr:hypothetical protein [Clostridia bacterium]